MAGHLDADGNTSRTEGAEDDKERAVLDTHSVNLSVLLLEHATKNTPRVRISPFPFHLVLLAAPHSCAMPWGW